MLKELAQILRRVRGRAQTRREAGLPAGSLPVPLQPPALLLIAHLEELLNLRVHPQLHLQPALELAPVILHRQPAGSPGPGYFGGVGVGL